MHNNKLPRAFSPWWQHKETACAFFCVCVLYIHYIYYWFYVPDITTSCLVCKETAPKDQKENTPYLPSLPKKSEMSAQDKILEEDAATLTFNQGKIKDAFSALLEIYIYIYIYIYVCSFALSYLCIIFSPLFSLVHPKIALETVDEHITHTHTSHTHTHTHTHTYAHTHTHTHTHTTPSTAARTVSFNLSLYIYLFLFFLLSFWFQF